MKKIYVYILCAFVIICLFLLVNQKDRHHNGNLVVSTANLQLREGPGLSYPSTSTLFEGQALTFIEEQSDWYYVHTGSQTGWVPTWFVVTKETSNNQPKEMKIAISQVDSLDVRSEPNLSAPIIKRLSSGEEVDVLNEENNWIQIKDQTELIGWISSEYVSINEKTVSNEQQPENSQPVTENKDIFKINMDAVHLRDDQSFDSTIIGTAYKGNEFDVVETDFNWVKIKSQDGNVGWIYQFYGSLLSSSSLNDNTNNVTILYNGTNLRQAPTTSSEVVARVDAGNSFKILDSENDWYKIELNSDQTAYVANWVVSTNSPDTVHTEDKEINRKKGTLNGVTIVLDPGHGGNDQGTAGYRGTIEKEITLMTAELLKSKLQEAGATVYLTRESDVYVNLRKRVSISHIHDADAFISIHYDSNEDSSITGFTTYYYHDYQQLLANYIHTGLADKINLRDRGVQLGDYLVVRENLRNAVLIELGYLSNPEEEQVITTDFYREQATLGIYEGIIDYFDSQL